MQPLRLGVKRGTLYRFLDVVEYLEREPAMYIPEDGYLCEDALGREYFVSLTGRVDSKMDGQWIMGWGICPMLKNEYDLMTAALDNVDEDSYARFDRSLGEEPTPEPGWDNHGRYHH